MVKTGRSAGGRGTRHRPHRPCFVLLSATALMLLGLPATADDLNLTRNTFGTVGLVEVPSARMAADSTLTIGGSFFENNQRYVLGFQALPWLEVDFRYAGLSRFDTSYPVYYDRSFAVKVRLWQESEFGPAIAVGINDVVGTGIYSSEYLALSKQVGVFDITLGMGWGRLASTSSIKNPLALLSSSFEVRNLAGTPGATNFNTLFHGPMVGLFGGASWTTPIEGLTLTAEYSSDKYTSENARGNFRPRNQFNFAADYKFDDITSFKLYWLNGKALGGSFYFDLSPTADRFLNQRMGDPPLIPQIRSPEQQLSSIAGMQEKQNANFVLSGSVVINQLVDELWQANLRDVLPQGDNVTITVSGGNLDTVCRTVAQMVAIYGAAFRTVTARMTQVVTESRCLVPTAQAARTARMRQQRPASIEAIRKDAGQQQITLETVLLGDSDAVIYYTNRHYQQEPEALDRLLRILMKNAPPGIERFRFIAIGQGIPIREFTFLRSQVEREFEQTDDIVVENLVTARPVPELSSTYGITVAKSYPRFNWSLFPQLRQEFFDPSNPVGAQLVMGAVGSIELVRGLSFSAEVETSVFHSFNTKRLSNSALPHVRTDFHNYIMNGRNGIGQLKGEYRFRLAPDVFAIMRAGYLESMFAGVGGEVLWRPDGTRWALGADLYEVKQRAFNRLFGLLPYHVLTGHVSLYYASPWYGMNFELRAGRYLAADTGVTLQVTRRFHSGVEIGAFMTKTNVSAARFGEGSFDKGIFIRIPITWFLPIHSQTAWQTVLRPVQRDGGQTLAGDATLYDETSLLNYETVGGD